MNFAVATITSMALEVMDSSSGEFSYTQKTLASLVAIPPNAEMGDYALPCFEFAKVLRQSPVHLAANWVPLFVAALPRFPLLQHVCAAGPYINFKLNSARVAQRLLPQIFDGSYFQIKPQPRPIRLMVEYSQPNTHKGFHVGHLRNVSLGDALCQIYRYNGYEVIAANYIGDVGAHIAKCLWYYTQHNCEQPPEIKRGEWLGGLYTSATRMLEEASPEEAPLYYQQIREILQKLEGKDPEWSQVWNTTRQWSLDEFEEIYRWLNVQFDQVFYESDVDELGRHIVLEEFGKGVFVRSEGAIGVDLDTEKLGFFLLLKTDGSTLYSTKDLALAKKKFEEFQIDESLYIVGAEQILHFQQVFATLQRMGYPQAKQCVHLPYGLVVLPSGKMSSRAGNVVLFSCLREEMTDFIQRTYMDSHRGEWSFEEIERTTHQIAVAAIKYGMLNQDPGKQIIFAMEDWLSSEGDTGTYLIYAYARIRSIQRQLEEDVTTEVNYQLLQHPNEQALIQRLLEFNGTVERAGLQNRPSLLTRYLYELAKEFSRAYQTSPVKNAETKELQKIRQLLFDGVGKVLEKGLGLLGITPPERM